LSATIGPEAEPRTSAEPKLPNGATTSPDQFWNDGRRLVMLMTPPSVLRPHNALSGPRTKSIWSMASSSMLDEFALSWGTPSM
jgi:hypothetical protein